MYCHGRYYKEIAALLNQQLINKVKLLTQASDSNDIGVASESHFWSAATQRLNSLDANASAIWGIILRCFDGATTMPQR